MTARSALTDEEFGRLWASQNGVLHPPTKVASGKYLWYRPEDNGYPYFHVSLAPLVDQAFYPTEAAAYADLGRAVREIRREIPDAAPPVPEKPYGDSKEEAQEDGQMGCR